MATYKQLVDYALEVLEKADGPMSAQQVADEVNRYYMLTESWTRVHRVRVSNWFAHHPRCISSGRPDWVWTWKDEEPVA